MAALRKLATIAQDSRGADVSLIASITEPETYEIPPPVRAYSGSVPARDPRWADNFKATIEAHSPAIELYRVAGAFVTPNAGILTRSGIVIEESLYPYVRASDINEAFKPFLIHEAGSPETEFSVLIRNMTCLKGDVVFARDHGEMGYFHWLHSVLPRLLITREQQNGAKNLVALTESFQRQSLEYSHFTDQDLVLSDGNTTYCDSLIYCSPMVCPDLTRSGGFFERSLLPSALLRSLPTYGASGRKILISRQDAIIRRFIGEPEIAAALQGDGFELVTLSGMPFHQQIELFASASVAVGIHGAGLANIAFMRTGSLVVEVLAPDRLWPTYRGVAARSHLHYAPYVGDRAGTLSERDSDISVVAGQFVDFVRECVRALDI